MINSATVQLSSIRVTSSLLTQATISVLLSRAQSCRSGCRGTSEGRAEQQERDQSD
jgi:hypothetical protein